MILGPAPQFGRSGYFKGKPNFVAFAKDYKQAGTLYTYDPAFRVSVDARHWRKGLLQGDILSALRSDGPLGAFFMPAKTITFKGWTIIVGALQRFVPSYQNRAAIYMGRGGYRYDRVALTNDLLNPGSSDIVDVAANDSYVAAIGRNGVLHYWNGEGDWQSRTDLPMGVSPTTSRHAYAIAASATGFVVAGSYGNNDGTPGAARVVSGSLPGGTFAARTLPATDRLSLAAKGNVMLVASDSSPTGALRIVASGLTDLVNWSAAGLSTTGGFEFLLHNGSKWTVGGGYNRLFYTSLTGTGGWSGTTDQAKTPWGVTPAERPVVNSALVVGGTFITHWGHYSAIDAGGVSLSDDAATWERIDAATAGLAARPYLLGSLAA